MECGGAAEFAGGELGPEETVKDDGLKVAYTREDQVVGEEDRRAGVDRGRAKRFGHP